MVLYRPADPQNLCFLIRKFLQFGKMTLSKKHEKEYVSCITYNGIPIPPPIMTEERQQQCRFWKKEAMLIEKELELKKKEKELEKLRASYESTVSSHSRPSSNGDSGACSLPIIELLRDAIYHRSIKDFHLLLQEITQELHKFVTGSELDFPDLKEFKFLLMELRKEILKRRNVPLRGFHVPQTIIKNSDSTYNDVAHVTFNQRSDSPNSFDTIREVSQFPLDRKSDSNSAKTYNDISLHSESTFKLLDECTPDDDSLSLANSLPADSSQCCFYESSLFTSSPKCGVDASDVSNPKQTDCEQINPCGMPDLNSPTKAIRRNSYTLETPSPSVLAYLRNLALESSKEKSMKNDNCDRSTEVNSSKSVVRNLNDIWDKENTSKKYMDDVSPDFRDSLEDTDDERLQNDENQNFRNTEQNSNCNELLTSYHEHQLAQSLQENDQILKKTNAAKVIQAYARGYLVRRLRRTYKVEQIKNTIKDAVICAWGLYGEQAVTPSDLNLHKRIIQQVTAACYELHSIFFKWSTSEKMALIRADRERLKNPKLKRMSREMRRSESASPSTRSSRPPSRTTSQNSIQSHKRTKSNEIDIKRPSTLPSTPRPLSLNYKPWR